MPKITRLTFEKIVRPMRTTFATALGSKTCATSVLIKVELDKPQGGMAKSGAWPCFGCGEVPTSFVLPHETVPAIKEILTAARRRIKGTDIENYPDIVEEFRAMYPKFHMTISGLEVALFRASLAARDKTEFRFWGARSRRIETDITIPFVPAPGALDLWLARAIKTGFSIYKIKVSGDLAADQVFLTSIHNALAAGLENFTIRLDGNQGFTVTSSLKLLDKLEKKCIGVELFEQPLRKDDYKGLKALTARCRIPVIADETVFSPDDCRRVIEERLAHGVNIKLAKSGIAHSREILTLAKKADLKLMIGCMTETMTGLSAAINFAAGTAGFDYIDLDSIHFLLRPGCCEGIGIAGKHYELNN